MNTLYGGLLLGGLISTGLNYISTIIGIIPTLILKYFGYGYFVIKNDPNKINEIIKILEKATTSTITIYEYGKIKPTGMFIGWKYCGMYSDNTGRDPERELYLYTTYKLFKLLVDTDQENTNYNLNYTNLDGIEIHNNEISNIIIFERTGVYYNFFYEKRIFNMSKYSPTMGQQNIIDSIKAIYTKEKRASIFISGNPGSGKSMIGFLLAKELNGILCRTFNPTDPGDTMIKLVRDTEQSHTQPLVLVIDEVNILLRKVTDGIAPHKNIPILVNDKITFNRFMDDMMFYENIILILTSNEPKKSMDDIDESYLRKGRIDEYFVL